MNEKHSKIAVWFQKNWIAILLILLGVALFIGNVCVLQYIDGNCQSAWLTLISGWVSGVATLFVGIIAYVQNAKFSREATKNNLINRITAYMSEFQIGYINHIQIDRIIDMSYRIRNCSIESNPRIKDDMELEINDDLIYYERNLLQFEAILMKGNYSSANIILLHKKLKEMEKKFDDFGLDNLDEQYDERYYFKECRKRIGYIKQWMKEADTLANSIMLDFQTLRSKLLTSKVIDSYLENTNNEEGIVTTYFQNLNNIQIQEQNNK